MISLIPEIDSTMSNEQLAVNSFLELKEENLV